MTCRQRCPHAVVDAGKHTGCKVHDGHRNADTHFHFLNVVYTVCAWQQWKKYDIDDRLVVNPHSSRSLRFADMSPDKEVRFESALHLPHAVRPFNSSRRKMWCCVRMEWQIWVPLIEKAFAVHAGGWDKIVGGSPTVGLACLTGCLETYYIMNRATSLQPSRYRYSMWKNAFDRAGSNSPHDNVRDVMRVNFVCLHLGCFLAESLLASE